MEDYKFLFKVVLVGNAGVGKTCLVRRFTQGLFPPGQGATIGVDFMIKTVEVEGEKIKLQIWDTAGQERFRSITQSYYRSAHALILVYDISCQPTFDCLPDWLREIQEYASTKVLKILVGNKTDRDDREIPTQMGKNLPNNTTCISWKHQPKKPKMWKGYSMKLPRNSEIKPEARTPRFQINNEITPVIQLDCLV
uniref:Ras-related protein Rab-30 n=1 Tax=Megaselia scalaris TaxID=36166 RepID=T1GWH3_MEGSC